MLEMATPSVLFDVPLEFLKDREIPSRDRKFDIETVSGHFEHLPRRLWRCVANYCDAKVAITSKRDKTGHIFVRIFFFFSLFCVSLVKRIPRVTKRPIYWKRIHTHLITIEKTKRTKKKTRRKKKEREDEKTQLWYFSRVTRFGTKLFS